MQTGLRVEIESPAVKASGLDLAESLSRTGVLSGIGPAGTARLARAARVGHLPRGNVLYRPEDPGREVFVLIGGGVQLYRVSTTGRRLLLDFVQPGDLFGETVLAGSGLHDSFAEVTADALIAAIRTRDLKETIAGNPSVWIRLIERMSRRVREVDNRWERSLFQPVAARLAGTLIELRERFRSGPIEISHEDLAGFLFWAFIAKQSR